MSPKKKRHTPSPSDKPKETSTTSIEKDSQPRHLFAHFTIAHRLSIVSLFVFVVGWVYLPALWGQPFLDDYSAILRNENIKSLSSIPDLIRMYYYTRGWVQISFALDWRIYSGAFWGLHLTNIVLHLLTAGLVWIFTRSLFDRFRSPNPRGLPSFTIGLPAALFFALLPINTQAVTYVIARADIMATLFYLLAMIFCVRWAEKLPDNSASLSAYWKPIVKILFAVMLGLGIGIGAKEIIITLPVMALIAVALAKRQAPLKQNLTYLGLITLPFIVLAPLYLVLRVLAFGSVLGFSDVQARPPLVNLMTQISAVVWYYIPRILFPFRLQFDPDYELALSAGDLRFLGALIVFLLLLVIAVRCIRRFPAITFGLLWFFITLAPTSSLIPLWDVLAERRIYMPSVGIAIIFETLLLTWAARPATSKKWVWGLTAAVGLYFGLFTYARNRDFSDPIVFWQKEYTAASSKPRIVRNLLHAYLKAGRMEEAKNLFTTMDWQSFDITKSIRRSEDINFIVRFMLTGGILPDRAVQMAEYLAEQNPRKPDILNTLQIAYLQTRQYDQAEEYVNRALAIDPKHLYSLLNKAYIQSIRKEHENALQTLEQAIQNHPRSIEALDQLIRYYEYLKRDSSVLKQRMEQLKAQKSDTDSTAFYLLD